MRENINTRAPQSSKAKHGQTKRAHPTTLCHYGRTDRENPNVLHFRKCKVCVCVCVCVVARSGSPLCVRMWVVWSGCALKWHIGKMHHHARSTAKTTFPQLVCPTNRMSWPGLYRSGPPVQIRPPMQKHSHINKSQPPLQIRPLVQNRY